MKKKTCLFDLFEFYQFLLFTDAIVEDVVQDTPTKESQAEYTLMLSKLKAFL